MQLTALGLIKALQWTTAALLLVVQAAKGPVLVCSNSHSPTADP